MADTIVSADGAHEGASKQFRKNDREVSGTASDTEIDNNVRERFDEAECMIWPGGLVQALPVSIHEPLTGPFFHKECGDFELPESTLDSAEHLGEVGHQFDILMSTLDEIEANYDSTSSVERAKP